MYPRPRARGPGRAVKLPDPELLAQQIADVRDLGGEPAAILAGPATGGASATCRASTPFWSSGPAGT
jgi:hypothetical protein